MPLVLSFQKPLPFLVHSLCFLLAVRNVSSQLFLPLYLLPAATVPCHDVLLLLWTIGLYKPFLL